jgi:hypothetical protein
MRRFKHKKRGTTYEMLGLAKMQISSNTTRAIGLIAPVHAASVLESISMVVYRSLHDDTLWIRPESAFFDGRFKEIK